MTVITAIATTHMNLVTESDRLDILFRGEIILDRLENWMTLLTISLDSKCILTVMADTARQTFLHIGH